MEQRGLEQLGAGTLMEIRKEAAAWLIEMDADPDHWNRQHFITWLKSSPRHMEEFLEQSALWAALEDASPGGVDLSQLPADLGNVVSWSRTAEAASEKKRRNLFRGWFASVTAAVLLISSTMALWGWMQRDSNVLTTAIGEQRSVRLADGSVVHLNTDTQLRIHFTEEAREVRLDRGEALFTVKRDLERPFRVQSDGFQVEALGTQFNVHRRASETIVSVVEGRVAVVAPPKIPHSMLAAADDRVGKLSAPVARQDQHQEEKKPSRAVVPKDVPYEGGRPAPASALTVLGAGEQASISNNGTVEEQSVANVAAAIAWRQRQLVFSNTPLSDVATEVARYNVVPKLEIEGDSLRARRLNGVFAADDPESLVQFLARDPALSVTRTGDSVVIRLR